MKTIGHILLIIMLLTAFQAVARNDRDTLGIGSRIDFVQNNGQWESRILFNAQMKDAALFLEKECITIVVNDPHNDHLKHFPIERKKHSSFRQHAYRMNFKSSQARIIYGEEKLNTYNNYFLSRDPSRWASKVPLFRTVIYEDLYPHVDMKVYSASNALKYDYIVHPQGSVEEICMQYEGQESLTMREGNLIVRTSILDIVELRPYAYQIFDGKDLPVEARYILKGDEVRIWVGDYDHSRDLIIDPFLYFSTYTGSQADNWGTTATFDNHKNTYTAGLVFGTGYPTSLGAYDGTFNGNADIGIFKFNPTGDQRLYATYLGGHNADMPHSLFVNSFDELVIFGTTGSLDFPVTPNAYDTSFNGGTAITYLGSTTINFPQGSDIFVSRFSQDGSTLEASTYIGGSANDGLNYKAYFNSNSSIEMDGNDSLYYNYGDGARGELITDDLNNIYIGSTTFSTDFPTTEGSFQPTARGNQEGIVLKIDYNLSNLLWCSYLGGTRDDAIYSIDVDDEYNLLVCGGTNSVNFNYSPHGVRHFFWGGSADGFIAKISYYGNELMASTYFGSNKYDQAYFVKTGKNNDVFVFGQTKAEGNQLIYNAPYNIPNSGQFIARLTPLLDTIIWSTTFGTGNGEPNISPTAFAVDVCNRVYATGWGRDWAGYTLNNHPIPWYTYGTAGLPVTNDAYQDTTDGMDFYIISLNEDASNLEYASFFGELHMNGSYSGHDHVDGGTSRFDKLSTLYQAVCASCSGFNDFPVTGNAWSTLNGSTNCNNAIFRFNVHSDFPVADFVTPPAGCAPYTVEFQNTGRAPQYHWDFGDGSTSTDTDPIHTYTTPGIYTVQLIASMPYGCTTSDTSSKIVMVLGNTSYPADTISLCPNQPVMIGPHPIPGCTYNWTSGQVSDSSIANPYIHQNGTYTLLVDNGVCTDTMRTIAVTGHASFSVNRDTSRCNSPMEFDINIEGNFSSCIWSGNNTFSDMLNHDAETSHLTFYPDTSCWLYVQVTDPLGCEETDSVFIDFYKVMDTVFFQPTLCPQDCSGKAIVELTSLAQTPYLYVWDGFPYSDSIRTDLCSGFHTVTFVDGNLCQVTKNFEITEPAMPEIHHQIVHIPCHDECTGSILLTVDGEFPPYRVVWMDDSSQTFTRQELCPGTYIAVITDSHGCTFTDTCEILDISDLSLHLSNVYNSCPNGCSGRALANLSGGLPPYAYLWNSGEDSPQATQLCEGWNYVEVWDQNGCHLRDSILIGMQHSFDSIMAWADDSVVFGTETTFLHATHIPQASYKWIPNNFLDNDECPDPIATIYASSEFIVTITDSIGCQYSDTVKVDCISVNCSEPNIFIPNTFSPNGDGKNDLLCFRGEWVKEFNIRIFNRWGELVWESKDITDCWDGKFKGEFCMPGVYTYVCKVTCEANQHNTLKGDITIIR